jgi:hypothetical protein
MPIDRTFIESWLAAWTGGEQSVDKLLSFYTPSARYQDPAVADLRGTDALRAYFKNLLRRYPAWRWEVLEIFATESGCVLKWKATLDERSTTGLDIVELRDGLIDRNEVYFDPSKLFPARSTNT